MFDWPERNPTVGNGEISESGTGSATDNGEGMSYVISDQTKFSGETVDIVAHFGFCIPMEYYSISDFFWIDLIQLPDTKRIVVCNLLPAEELQETEYLHEVNDDMIYVECPVSIPAERFRTEKGGVMVISALLCSNPESIIDEYALGHRIFLPYEKNDGEITLLLQYAWDSSHRWHTGYSYDSYMKANGLSYADIIWS